MKKAQLILSICFLKGIFFLSSPLYSLEDHLLFPIPMKVAGIGDIYGLGYTSKSLLFNDDRIAIGKTSGKTDALGLFYGAIPLLGPRTKMNFAYANVENYQLRTSYTRGFEEEQAYNIVGQALLSLISLDYATIDEHLQLSASLTNVAIRFKNFLNTNDEALDIPDLFITDLNQSILQIGAKINFLDALDFPENGISFGSSYTSNGASAGYSGSEVISVFANIYFGLTDSLLFASRFLSSDAKVTQKKIPTQEEVKKHLAADCTKSTKKEECNTFIEHLSSFIARHNSLGTALFLGGQNRLRSYYVSRFKAAHTRYLSGEIKMRSDHFFLFKLKNDLVIFQEAGQANDLEKFIDEKTIISRGAELRMHLAQSEYRIGYAASENANEFYAVFGKAF